MKTLTTVLAALAVSLALTANVSANGWQHGGVVRGGYHGHYQRGYGRGYSRFGYVPWVVGGAVLFGAIAIDASQTAYVDNGVPYQRVDTYCTDAYGQPVYNQFGRPIICGYEWVQQ